MLRIMLAAVLCLSLGWIGAAHTATTEDVAPLTADQRTNDESSRFSDKVRDAPRSGGGFDAATYGVAKLSPAVSATGSSPEQWWERTDWLLAVPVWLLALAAAAFAIYTARLSQSTIRLVEQASETAKHELRAYVALDEIFFSDADEPAATQHKLKIRNYGQTPGSAMSIWCERASHLPQEGVKPFYDTPTVDCQLLHPVQAVTVGLAVAPLYRIGKPGFFTYGRIIYRDVYTRWWVTKFCYRYEGDGSFVPHGDYNSEEGPFDHPPV